MTDSPLKDSKITLLNVYQSCTIILGHLLAVSTCLDRRANVIFGPITLPRALITSSLIA